jgi:hypothetical protein
MKNLSTNKTASKGQAQIFVMCEDTVAELKSKGMPEDVATSMVVDAMKLSGGDVVILKSLFSSLIEVAC